MYQCIATVLSSLLLAAPLGGGDAAETAPVTSVSDGSFDRSLLTKWDAAARGPLLIVDPNDENRFLAFTSVGLSFNPKDATRMTRSVRQVGAISAVVPQYTYSVNRNANISPLLSLTRPELWQLLEVSLTEPQIKALCGAGGLAASSLTGEQRQIYDLLLPNPLRVRELKGSSAKLYGEAAGEITVSDADRGNVRLKMSLSSAAYLPVAAPTPGASDMGVFVGFRTPLVNSEGGFSKYRVVDGASRASLFLTQVPNRLKTSDMPYDSPGLQAKGDIPPAGSVSDLLAIVSKQTGVPLGVDVRVGKLSFRFIGSSAGCSDILKALALSVGGTYRRLPGAKEGYLLCHERQGEAASKFPIGSWYLANSAERHAYLRSRLPLLANGGFAGQMGFGKDELFSVDDATRERIFQQTEQGKHSVTTIPISQLSADGQDVVRQTVSNYQAYQANPSPQQPVPGQLRDGVVNVSLSAKVTLEVPDIGSVEDSAAMFQPLQGFLPKTAPSVPVGPGVLEPQSVACHILTPDTDIDSLGATLAGAPTTDPQLPLFFDVSRLLTSGSELVDKRRAEAGRLFRTLSARGSKIFIACGLYGEPVADTVKTPDTSHPATPASLPLADGDALLDRNALGMDSVTWQEWYGKNVLRQSRATRATFSLRTRWLARRDTSVWVNRLRELAEPIGVEAIVLTDVAPNGYASDATNNQPSRPAPPDEFIGADFGYTEEMRGAFIEKYGCDPADLLPTSLSTSSLNPRIPFFPDDVTLSQRWAEFRAEKRAAQVASIVSELRKSTKEKRIFLSDTLYSDRTGMLSSPVFREVPRPNDRATPGSQAASPQSSASFLLLDESVYGALTFPKPNADGEYGAVMSLIARYKATKPDHLFTVVRGLSPSPKK